MKHAELINQVMAMLLRGDEEVLCILREQYEKASIVLEEDEEVGFFIHYEVNNALGIKDDYKDTFQIGDVDGEINGIDGAVGFILYVKNGYLTMLEGYTNIIEKWPETDSEIKLVYDTKQRDYVTLRKKWQKD